MPDHPTRPDIHLLDPRFYLDPHPRFSWMRAHAPVYRDERAGLWGVTRYGDIMHVSKHPRLFCSGKSSRPDAPAIPSMINMDAPMHMKRRKLVNAGFTPKHVQDHEPFVRRTVTALIDAVCEQGRCDFVRDLATPLPMIMIGELLGIEQEHYAEILEWSDLFGTGAESMSPEFVARAQAAFLSWVELNRRIVADRRAHPRDDLISVITHAEIDGERLDDEALLHESLLILVGGDETTRHVISGGMEALLQHPAALRLLQREPSRIPVAVEEILRWVTPIQNMNRTATQDVELGGQKIREGDKLILLYPSGNRDERVFPHPFRFDVERRPNDHVAFGGYGPHHCLGASLARLELRVFFEEALRRLPDLRLATSEPLPRRAATFITGIERMPVEFSPVRREGAAP